MARWRCIISIPVEFDIDYATDLRTARLGADNLRKQQPRIIDEQATGGAYEPKIMSIIGPKEQIEAWASKRREELAVAAKPSGPPIPDRTPEDDGPQYA